MHGGGYRKNGGIGFAVEEPKTVIQVCPARNFAFVDERQNSLTQCERAVIRRVIDGVQEGEDFRWSISCRVFGEARPHVGLGMGTGVRLAMLEAIYRLNGVEATEELLVHRSRRGGTSGIGIRTYFHGGLVLDLGVRNDDQRFLPSSTSRPTAPPRVLARAEMPDWPVCLCLPLKLRPRTQAEEREFFARTAPVSEASAYEATYHAVFGAYAAAAEDNLDSFCWAVDKLQTVEWKLRERELYGNGMEECTAKLKELGMRGIGMSSLGPLLYCFGPNVATSQAKQYPDDDDCMIFLTSPSNRGRSVSETVAACD